MSWNFAFGCPFELHSDSAFASFSNSNSNEMSLSSNALSLFRYGLFSSDIIFVFMCPAINNYGMYYLAA